MLRRIDRILLRVPSLGSAVNYYRDVLGMKVLRRAGQVASLALVDQDAELVLHADPDLPAEAIYFLVDDVRELYRRRAEFKLKFQSPPVAISRGYRAAVKDPFGTLLLLLDRTADPSAADETIEDAKAPGALFAGVETKSAIRRERLIELYKQLNRTADDLPYTPHFETLYSSYTSGLSEPLPTRQEVWRHLLTIRKAGGLPRLGVARTKLPAIEKSDEQQLRALLGEELGRRDRLPYTERFDAIVDDFNKTRQPRLSPHLVWRIVAKMAK